MELERNNNPFETNTPLETVWQPLFYRAFLQKERAELDVLRQSGSVLYIHDTLCGQLEELLVGRRPSEKDKLSPASRAALVNEHLQGTLTDEYGTWVYYPWSRRLVHVLPKAEFREVRSSRNLYLISPEETQRLLSARIGVVGLSVGRAVLTTLARESIGGTFRLTDFDHLELSNMNRLQGSVHDLGVSKVVLAARELFEMDPYLQVEIFPGGLKEDNIDAFFGSERRLDLVVDECDDLFIKIFARERARALGIPVVMSTSDRGMVDIERFDCEPGRPVLHGLLNQVDAKSLKGLATKDKVPYVMDILDPDRMSERALASLVEVGETIVTWPQLASSVVLGAAIIADVARRILLGQMRASGRFYVDLSELVSDATAWTPKLKPRDVRSSQPISNVLPEVVDRRHDHSLKIDKSEVRTLVEYATLAPSGGNIQPWRFVYKGSTLACHRDPERGGVLDFCGWYSQLALGAAVENLNLAARSMGIEAVCRVLPKGSESTLVCAVDLMRAQQLVAPDPLLEQVQVRMTNRRMGRRTDLPKQDIESLKAVADKAGAELRLLTAEEKLAEIGKMLAQVDRTIMLEPKFHAALMGELRWTAKEAERTRDGIDVNSLELSPLDRVALDIIARPRVVATVGRLGGGGALGTMTRKWIDCASAVGLVLVGGATEKRHFQGGRALQRIWLTATERGIGLHPITILTALHARAKHDPDSLSSSALKTLNSILSKYFDLFGSMDGMTDVFLFRLHREAMPEIRDLRRPIEDILMFKDEKQESKAI